MLCSLCHAVKSLSLAGKQAVTKLISQPGVPSASSASRLAFSSHASATSVLSATKPSWTLALVTSTRLGLAPAFHLTTTRWIATSPVHDKSEDWKAMLRSLPKRDEGTEGERDLEFDPTHARFSDVVEFPDENTPDRLFNGVPFSQLPMICVRTHKNNTIIILADMYHKIIWRRSCGLEGFKNCRKGTNVAAQATALSMAKKAQEFGIKQVRVKLRGFGPGRLASIKGFQLGGLDVVSITDVTYINWRNVPRPRKMKRL